MVATAYALLSFPLSDKLRQSWALCPHIWQQEHNILNFTSEKHIFPPQKDYMKETWLETGSGFT